MSLERHTAVVVHTAECVLFRKRKRYCYDKKSHVTAINRAVSAFIPWRDLAPKIQIYLLPTNLICTCQLRRLCVKSLQDTPEVRWIKEIRFVNYHTPLTFVLSDHADSTITENLSPSIFSALDKRILEFLS
jgi:hypothetical protein